MQAVVTRLENKLDVFSLGAQSGLLWANHDLIVAGFGQFRTFNIDSLAKLSTVGDALSRCRVESDPLVDCVGPTVFGALAFDPAAASQLYLPQITVVQVSSGDQYLTVVNSDEFEELDSDAALQLIQHRNSLKLDHANRNAGVVAESVVEARTWQNQVAEAITRIAKTDLKKVVLAREVKVLSDLAIEPSEIVNNLSRAFPKAILFRVGGFLGASPEMLVSRVGSRVKAHPLAGTAKRLANVAEDNAAKAALLESTKDQWEHRITIDWFLDRLLPYCSFVDAEPEPTIVELANVHHLGTKVEGVLNSAKASVVDLVQALHPTPAVGGDPQKLALQTIADLEPGSRGCYAGPVGWLDHRGNGEFAVGIRSAQVDGSEASVFAGVGVVEDSLPQAELRETEAKLEALLKYGFNSHL